jgi:alkylation response protein AidB-like acyl-CoA dehydrogenase
MNFSFSDDQQAIRDLARRIFDDRVTDTALLEFTRSGKTWDEELWAILVEQGLIGVAVPECLGGGGMGLVELCLLLEEQGRRLAPVPLYSSVVLGALPLVRFGSEAQQARWLASMLAGRSKLTAAVAELGMNEAIVEPVIAARVAGGWELTGARDVVIDGATADCILVPATSNDGEDCVFLVDTSLPGVAVEAQQVSLLGARAAHLQLNRVRLADTDVLGRRGQGREILDWLEQHANLAHCALQLGIAEEAIKRTATYISERRQFGVPLGSFQAPAMRMADCYIDVEAMRSTYWLALWRLGEGLDARTEIRAAKWWACSAAQRIVQSAQHLHGGIGADVDYPIHRFFLWAKQISYALGSADTQLTRLGELLAKDDSLGFRALAV